MRRQLSSVDESLDLLRSWARTLLKTIGDRPPSVGELLELGEELCGALRCVEDAIRRHGGEPGRSQSG